MSDSITIASRLKVYERGIFNLDELYKAIKGWLVFEGFGDHEKTFREESYVERIKGDAKQIEIKWKAEKLINEYISYVLTITYNINGLTEIEIEQDGRKIKMNKGLVIIFISSKIILDRQDKWKSDFFRSIYENLIIREKIEAHKEDLYNKTYKLQNELKAFFDMNR